MTPSEAKDAIRAGRHVNAALVLSGGGAPGVCAGIGMAGRGVERITEVARQKPARSSSLRAGLRLLPVAFEMVDASVVSGRSR